MGNGPSKNLAPAEDSAVAPTSAPNFQKFSYRVTVKQSKACDKYGPLLHLSEVQLFRDGEQVPQHKITSRLTSTFNTFQAILCNDGDVQSECHTDFNDANPCLTITSTEAFDEVFIINARNDCGLASCRLTGSVVSATLDGENWSTATIPEVPRMHYRYLPFAKGPIVKDGDDTLYSDNTVIKHETKKAIDPEEDFGPGSEFELFPKDILTQHFHTSEQQLTSLRQLGNPANTGFMALDGTTTPLVGALVLSTVASVFFIAKKIRNSYETLGSG